ncbi:3-oxosteroid 1-dehydrogenase-like [Ylistrum balloti]|uniref:3-oxosteroid 1-dehydrogenase-like n=1 Tax=Ylistrum balloti TaxID=509963 RepID=UPI00290588AC|nr:3-oxosteroid 1-dehydrogenase-like [Ylistrum balloti]
MATAPAQWNLEVDVVIAGSGLGAMSAAIVAQDNGLKVAILEKAPKLGGVCAYSGGEVFVPCNYKMLAEGTEDNETEAFAYLDFLAGGYANKALQRILFDKGREAAEYLGEKAGIAWKTIKGFPDYHYPHAPGTLAEGRYLEVELFNGPDLKEWQKKTYLTPHMPPGINHDTLFEWGSVSCVTKWDFAHMGKQIGADQRGMGPGMMGYFVKAALIDRTNAQAFVETPVRELITEGSRVIGVRAEAADGNDFFVKANKGVLLGVGGYDWNEEMAIQFEGLPEWKSMCQPHLHGDNIVLGGEVGASLGGVPSYNLGMFFGYTIPGEEHDGHPLCRASWEGGYPHAIWVNDEGKRFCDESFYREYLPKVHGWDGVKQQHTNYPPYLIFDSNYREKYSFATFLPGMQIPDEMIVKADTPRELAEKLGIDADNFVETLERFNSFADGETDPDFGRGTYPWAAKFIGDRDRPNPNMGPLNKAPYYGIKLIPVGVGVNCVGLKTTATGQVQHVRGHGIEGLYACGNAAAPLDTGAGYQSGLSNLRNMTWGYVAAQHMCGIL